MVSSTLRQTHVPVDCFLENCVENDCWEMMPSTNDVFFELAAWQPGLPLVDIPWMQRGDYHHFVASK